jgi:hypothetical protein
MAPVPSEAYPDPIKYPVEISSGEIKLNPHPFTLEPNSNMMILLDFDGDKSIHETGGGSGKSNGKGNNPSAEEDVDPLPQRGRFKMNPVIRVVSVGDMPS